MQNIPPHYLHTIHQYEVTIKRPMHEQIVRKHNGHYSLRVAAAVEDIITYSQQCEKYLSYITRTDQFKRSMMSGTLRRSSQLLIGDTPEYLLNLGFQQHPIMYARRHFALAQSPVNDPHNFHQHPIGVNKIKQFAELLDHPLLLADDRTNPDALLILLPDVDQQGNPLLACLQPEAFARNSKNSMNQLLTVFGRENYQQFHALLEQENRIIWENKKMLRTPGRIAKRQLLGDYPQLGTSDTSIRIPECIVNKYQEGVLAVTPEIETRINKQLHPQLSVQNIATRLNNIVTSSSIKPSMMKPRNRFNR